MMKSLTIDEAAERLKQNEVVIIPTETVYGLAANIYSDEAIRKVFALKKRPLHNPLIVHIKSIDDLTEVASQVPEVAYRLARNFWPGPLTLVLPKQPSISPLITAGKDTVAIRMPDHPVTLSLLKKTGFPLAAPSANPFNYISPTSSDDVRKAFPELADSILEGGPCKRGIESTVIGFHNNDVYLYRYGAVTAEEIEKVLGKKLLITNHDSEKPSAPGMLSKHYSPKSRLITTTNVLQDIGLLQGNNIGVLSFRTHYQHKNIRHQIVLSESGDLREAARNFFAALYALDALSLDYIVAELLPQQGLGISVNDRLTRAAAKS
ncbi:MAG TPA: L-threonylcarbamoyladenylate synthase [Chitinophagaceae bacterium]|jgi:L-threonylcarbamoyladenylate synthase|nr:L-threonylcarbamoyladenylate synthase [Chitinophagaceae bacterium]